MTPEMPLVPDFRTLARQEQRRWALIGVLGFLLAISIGLNGYQAIEVRTAVDSLESTAADTQRAVELLEGRTPLFGELQQAIGEVSAAETRVECVSRLNAAVLDALAAGLVASAVGDQTDLDQAAGRVAEARTQLSMLGTAADPCPKEGS